MPKNAKLITKLRTQGLNTSVCNWMLDFLTGRPQAVRLSPLLSSLFPVVPGNLGCFKDSGDPPTLTGSSQTSNKLTVQNCISFCRKQRYMLAGMESGYACFCGNNLDLRLHGKAPSMECNHVCFGDHTQPCGGDGWVIVFDTRVGACGGNYSAPSGVVYSPDFPDKYGAGRVCYWTVQVPGASVILFNFTFFDISDQTDMVELLDGYTNQVSCSYPPFYYLQ
nr:kremen protein 1-like [Salvelinus alpinus]